MIMLITCVIIKNENTNIRKLGNLTLDNIDALALNEDNRPDLNCYGEGEIDCIGVKVEYKNISKRFFEFEDLY